MNPIDETLRRLLRSAARHEPARDDDLPVGFETRVLADWRANRARGNDWAPLCWRAGLTASCAALVAVAICLADVRATVRSASMESFGPSNHLVLP